jgi:hypothetical protein
VTTVPPTAKAIDGQSYTGVQPSEILAYSGYDNSSFSSIDTNHHYSKSLAENKPINFQFVLRTQIGFLAVKQSGVTYHLKGNY